MFDEIVKQRARTAIRRVCQPCCGSLTIAESVSMTLNVRMLLCGQAHSVFHICMMTQGSLNSEEANDLSPRGCEAIAWGCDVVGVSTTHVSCCVVFVAQFFLFCKSWRHNDVTVLWMQTKTSFLWQAALNSAQMQIACCAACWQCCSAQFKCHSPPHGGNADGNRHSPLAWVASVCLILATCFMFFLLLPTWWDCIVISLHKHNSKQNECRLQFRITKCSEHDTWEESHTCVMCSKSPELRTSFGHTAEAWGPFIDPKGPVHPSCELLAVVPILSPIFSVDHQSFSTRAPSICSTASCLCVLKIMPSDAPQVSRRRPPSAPQQLKSSVWASVDTALLSNCQFHNPTSGDNGAPRVSAAWPPVTMEHKRHTSLVSMTPAQQVSVQFINGKLQRCLAITDGVNNEAKSAKSMKVCSKNWQGGSAHAENVPKWGMLAFVCLLRFSQQCACAHINACMCQSGHACENNWDWWSSDPHHVRPSTGFQRTSVEQWWQGRNPHHTFSLKRRRKPVIRFISADSRTLLVMRHKSLCLSKNSDKISCFADARQTFDAGCCFASLNWSNGVSGSLGACHHFASNC